MSTIFILIWILIYKELQVQNDISANTIDNVIKKLYAYMERTNQNMHALANSMGFTYQPFYRLMMKKSLPTVSSLENIAMNLKCSVAELTDDNMFIDVQSFESIQNYLENKSSQEIRIYIPHNQIQPKIHQTFFAIKIKLPSLLPLYKINNIDYISNSNIYQIFTKTERIDLDGYFWVKYKGAQSILEVLSVSSSMLIVNYNNQEIKIPVSEVAVYARFFSFLELSDREQKTLSGRYK